MGIKKCLSLLLAMAMLAVFVSCGKAASEDTLIANDENTSAAAIQSKYKGQEKYEYAPPVYSVERGHAFEFVFSSSIFENEEYEDLEITEFVNVYQDADFTRTVQTSWKAEKAEDGTAHLFMGPGTYPAFSISSIYADEGELELYAHGDDALLYFKGEEQDWGNLPQYYIVQWKNFETGEDLQKPIITIFTVKAELPTPEVTFYTTDEGRAGFKWNAVEGAEKYYLVRLVLMKDETDVRYGFIEAQTTNTYWEDPGAEDGEGLVNHTFRSFRYSLDDANWEFTQEEIERLGEEAFQDDRHYLFGVVAVNTRGSSSAALFDQNELTSTLPYSIGYATMTNETGSLSFPAQISALPVNVPVVMCDGQLVYKMVEYDVENANTNNEFGSFQIPWKIKGTPFYGYSVPLMLPEEEEALLTSLQDLKIRQEELTGRSGGVPGAISNARTVADEDHETEENSSESVSVPVQDNKSKSVLRSISKVYATTAMSEYITVCLLRGQTTIDLGDFPEASDVNKVWDAYDEACYQNPMIMYIDKEYYSASQRKLTVEFGDTKEVREQKKNAVAAEVQIFLDNYITADMSDLEKVFAINNYICSTAEYNWDAYNQLVAGGGYANAAIGDNWTPYGILVNKTAVCGGYAAAFKIMAQAAGIDAIVVDGFIDGDQSAYHAWNRVYINGEWKTVDATNNDIDEIPNVFLNLPDSWSASKLVEYARYIGDDSLGDYTASGAEGEYYTAMGLYFSQDQMSGQMASRLANSGACALRTDLSLDQAGFQVIIDGTAQKTNNRNLYGYYWMGVVNIVK